MENNENKLNENEAAGLIEDTSLADVCDEDISPEDEPSQTAPEADATEPEYQPKNRYERLLCCVYRDETLAEMLKISSFAIVILTAYAFIVRLLTLIPTPIELVRLLAVTGAPFVLVSIMRRCINAPRPYELLGFYKKKPKGKAGRSFPSRHVFSVFIIATVLAPYDPILSAVLFVGGAVLAFLRVALGIHFMRDVVAGALIGAASGGIGLLVLHFIR